MGVQLWQETCPSLAVNGLVSHFPQLGVFMMGSTLWLYCTKAVLCSTVHSHGLYTLLLCYVSVACRFVQFADSGYEADPEIDRIEQQVSLFH